MANIGLKAGIYYVRFRFGGQEFKRSLKVRDKDAAQAAKNIVELTIYRLLTGQLVLPPNVDPGDFIVGGGTVPQELTKVEPPTWEEALACLRREMMANNNRERTVEDYCLMIGNVRKIFPNTRGPSDITPTMARAFKVRRMEAGKSALRNWPAHCHTSPSISL
jgi:hypothetical protein